MNWYEILTLFGVPGISVAICGYLYKKVKSSDIQIKAAKKGIQALLRAQMISEFNKAKDKGYSAIYAKDNFENLWQNYHALGLNGVMDGIRERYMNLPNRKEDAFNYNENEDILKKED